MTRTARLLSPLTAASGEMEQLYDFDLQQGGGHLKGWKLTDAQMDAVADALAAMCTPEAMEKKYGLKDAAPLLFAVGDGNHSLATAKQCYENLKKVTPEDQWAGLPARYALVEVVNNHDDALQFEPIHRVLFGVEPEQVLEAMKAAYPGAHEGRARATPSPTPMQGIPVPSRCPIPGCSWRWERSRPSWTPISRSTAAKWTTSMATK